jgi:hypothetical protein
MGNECCVPDNPKRNERKRPLMISPEKAEKIDTTSSQSEPKPSTENFFYD